MKLLYKPFNIIGAIISARLGRNVFKKVWSKVDEQDPPDPTTAETTFPKAVGAAALEAATMAAVAAAVDRAGASAFHYLTGIWPGERRSEKSEG
jgi:predicted DNA-binding transcriptional regulator YafY